MQRIATALGLTLLLCLPALGDSPVVNSIGMKLLPIEAGSFTMGSDQSKAGWDEQPVHQVTISQPFLISELPVTIEEYQKFKPGAKLNEACAPYAAGMSWYDATAFCAWLSKQDQKTYRLPTEAEWEYAARSNPGMIGFSQWCQDWYGAYPYEPQIDPLGYSDGRVKVIRGMYLDEPSKYSNPKNYLTPTARAGMPPNFGPLGSFGLSKIGFRVVQGEEPEGTSLPYVAPYARQGVKQTADFAAIGPDPSKPYFRKRRMLPIPPEDSPDELIRRAGLDPSFRHHNHSPGMEILPNGDVLLIIYTSHNEYEPEVSLIASRLRFGADEWDFPSPMFDTPGANDHAPLLYNDRGTVYLFWGNPYAWGHFPFQFVTSVDNGADWTGAQYPDVLGPIAKLGRPQPINTVVRDLSGTMYVPTDGEGSHAILWATDDNGKTWRDTGGRTAGRHTTFVLLKDGSILGLGGKDSDINGYMPQSVTRDGGKTYEVSPSPFHALRSAQRPCVIRLQSGRILMAGDWRASKGPASTRFSENGCYVALSDDEGKTWRFKTLPGTQPGTHGFDTLGYCVARQGRNGDIHLITTLTHPALDLEFNEAWILSDDTDTDEAKLTANSATDIHDVHDYRENYPDGSPRITWSAGIGNDGRYLLEGPETWYYPSGVFQRQAAYHLGKKVDTEIYFSPQGIPVWQWEYQPDGTADYATWYPNGNLRSQSKWKNMELIPKTDQYYDYPGQSPSP
jgi:hypothetical protein